MRVLVPVLALLTGSVAFAGSELSLKSTTPVELILDGESQGNVQPLEPLVVDIEPGVHTLQLKGLLGRDLYDRDLIFDEGTRTELHWQRKELRLGQVVKLGASKAPPPEPVEEPEPVEAPEAPEAPVVVAAPPVVEQLPVPVAEAPEPPPPASTPAKTAPAAPAKAAAPAPKAAPSPVSTRAGSVVVEATEGLDLQISHQGQLLRVTVDDGELVITDPNGTEIRFPAHNDAW